MKRLGGKNQNRILRHRKIRAKVSGSALKPRLSVYRSNRYLYAQLIDDQKSVTLLGLRGDDAKTLGEKMAVEAQKKNIKNVVFDRGGFLYTGKVKALAEAARAGGLHF